MPMDSATRATIMHTVEVAVIGAIVITVMIVFRDTINGLLMHLANSQGVLDALQAVVVALLTVIGSAAAKRLRTMDGGKRDYVNKQ